MSLIHIRWVCSRPTHWPPRMDMLLNFIINICSNILLLTILQVVGRIYSCTMMFGRGHHHLWEIQWCPTSQVWRIKTFWWRMSISTLIVYQTQETLQISVGNTHFMVWWGLCIIKAITTIIVYQAQIRCRIKIFWWRISISTLIGEGMNKRRQQCQSSYLLLWVVADRSNRST